MNQELASKRGRKPLENKQKRVGLYVRPMSRANVNEIAARLEKLHGGQPFSQSDAIDWLANIGKRELDLIADGGAL